MSLLTAVVIGVLGYWGGKWATRYPERLVVACLAGWVAVGWGLIVTGVVLVASANFWGVVLVLLGAGVVEFFEKLLRKVLSQC